MPIVQVVLIRKPDVLKLAAEDEDGMIHSLLNALPLLDEGSETKKDAPFDQSRLGSPDEVDKTTFSTVKAEMLSKASEENAGNELPIEQQHIIDHKSCFWTESGASNDAANGRVVREENDIAADDRSVQRLENSDPALFLAEETSESAVTDSTETHIEHNADIDVDNQLHTTHSRPCTTTFPRASRSSSRIESRSSSFSVPPVKSSQAPISLSSLLTHAAQLLEAYPPTLPELHVKDILGPKSVVHTWRSPLGEVFSAQSDDERDDEAERWVGGPDVIIPFIEEEDIEESETERKTKSRKGPVTKRRRPFFLPRIHLRFGVLTPTERRVLLIGTVVVVGLAITIRQNRSLADMKRGWMAWADAFVGSRIPP